VHWKLVSVSLVTLGGTVTAVSIYDGSGFVFFCKLHKIEPSSGLPLPHHGVPQDQQRRQTSSHPSS